MIGKKKCPNCGNVVRGKGKYCTYQCSFPAQREAIEQLRKKEGPIYEKWKARYEIGIKRFKESENGDV